MYEQRDKVGGVYYTTENYEIFKNLLGNRDVTEERRSKIINSILTRGYILNPLVVNEKYEVIDGGGRLSALKQLGMPVDYVIVPGLTIEDCISMNINLKNWSTSDYIKSYADQGNVSYIRLWNLISNYDLPLVVVIAAAKGTAMLGWPTDALKLGRIELNESNYSVAKEKLAFIEEAKKYIKKTNALLSVMFCWGVNGCDRDRLLDVCKNNPQEICKMSKLEDIIGCIEDLYNYRRPERSRILFKHLYKKYCRESNSAYQARWGEERSAKK